MRRRQGVDWGGGGEQSRRKECEGIFEEQESPGGGGAGQGPAAVIYIHTYVHIVQLGCPAGHAGG